MQPEGSGKKLHDITQTLHGPRSGLDVLRCRDSTCAKRVERQGRTDRASNASEEYRRRCTDAGFVGHISKPYNTHSLIREIDAAVART